MKRILFVCLGNICRSPLAEGIFTQKAKELGLDMEFDSAGTGGWHAGEAPDRRMQDTAFRRGVDIRSLSARQFKPSDFNAFDHIYVMDASNYRDVIAQAKNQEQIEKVSLILNEVNPGSDQAVPDPYFGGQNGFDQVFDLLEEAADKVLNNDLR